MTHRKLWSGKCFTFLKPISVENEEIPQSSQTLSWHFIKNSESSVWLERNTKFECKILPNTWPNQFY